MKKQLSVALLCLIFLFTAGCGDAAPRDGASGAGGVDIDLTALSGTVVYAEVYNITAVPKDYIGKVIKVDGTYYAAYDDDAGRYHHFVVIEDAAACCAQGLEFIWSGERAFPDDYPEQNATIGMTGVFESYEERGVPRYYLAVDDLIFL